MFFLYFCKKKMISLIICSRNPDISVALKQNIENTIGTGYELIVVDNSHTKYSIFSAYNLGTQKARGEFLCFMHEDILYHTNNWGNAVCSYFDKYCEVGMIGVAGTHFLPNMPAAWWDTEIRSGQLLQGYTNNDEYKINREVWSEYKKDPTVVASVDGLWMCFRRELFSSIKWDDMNFKGFHGYDTDISLQVWNSGFEVHIFWGVLIEHISCGAASSEFYKTLNILYGKWKDQLPIIKGVELSESEQSARCRIAELRHEVHILNCKLSDICKSRAYRRSLYFQNPVLLLRSLLIHLKRIP